MNVISKRRERYDVELITPSEKKKILAKFEKERIRGVFSKIHRTNLKFSTNVPEFAKMWKENFYAGGKNIRASLFAVNDEKRFEVLYEPASQCLVVKNCDYYGWVKSMALALVGEVLEEKPKSERAFSIHGSAIDFDGNGLCMMGPSGTGKTTLTYGLLANGARYVSDDWVYARLLKRVLAFSSEKNSYVREDLARVWKLPFKIKGDGNGRGIANLAKVFGAKSVKKETHLQALVLLKRDGKDARAFRKITGHEAFEYLKENDYCNPQHQLIRNAAKTKLRNEFFKELTKRLDCFMLNTTETPEESLSHLESIF